MHRCWAVPTTWHLRYILGTSYTACHPRYIDMLNTGVYTLAPLCNVDGHWCIYYCNYTLLHGLASTEVVVITSCRPLLLTVTEYHSLLPTPYGYALLVCLTQHGRCCYWWPAQIAVGAWYELVLSNVQVISAGGSNRGYNNRADIWCRYCCAHIYIQL